MIPTREKASPKKKATGPKKGHTLKEYPIFFKNTKIESVIPKQASGIGSVKKAQKTKTMGPT